VLGHGGEQQHYLRIVQLLFLRNGCENEIYGLYVLYVIGYESEIYGLYVLYVSGYESEIYGLYVLYVNGCVSEIYGLCDLYVSVNVSESEIYVFLDLFYFCNLYVQFFCDHIYSVNESGCESEIYGLCDFYVFSVFSVFLQLLLVLHHHL
jgi:hypothetical protein